MKGPGWARFIDKQCRLVVCLELGKKWEVTIKGHGVSFGGFENILKLTVAIATQL